MGLVTETPLVLPNKPWITRDPAGHSTWYHAWPLVAFRLSGDRTFENLLQGGNFDPDLTSNVRYVVFPPI
jgi:hypothetical protein